MQFQKSGGSFYSFQFTVGLTGFADNYGNGNSQEADMGKRIQICDGGQVPYPHPFLPRIFEPRIVAFTFHTQRIMAFEIAAIPVNGRPQVIGDRNIFGAAAMLPAIIKVFVMAGTVSIFG